MTASAFNCLSGLALSSSWVLRQLPLHCGNSDVVERPFPLPLRCSLPIIIETECRLYVGVQRREDLLIFLSVPLDTMGALELGQPQVHDRLGLA